MQKYYRKWLIILSIPSIIIFFIIIIMPFIMGIIYSFTDWRGAYFTGGDHWWNSIVGLKNYMKAFSSAEFCSSLIYTTKYTVIAVIFQNFMGLALALLVKKVISGKGIFRTVFFLPYILGGLAMGYVWKFIFENVFTKILFGENSVLHIGFLTNMLQDSNKALFAIAIMSTWQCAGYFLLIYLNGINNIPKEIIEASAIDGASAWKRFWSIIVPLIMPSITIGLFLTLSSSFKMLDVNIALTEGDFGTSMVSYVILNTIRASSPPEYGVAQAEAVVFFVIIVTISIVQLIFTKGKEIET